MCFSNIQTCFEWNNKETLSTTCHDQNLSVYSYKKKIGRLYEE